MTVITTRRAGEIAADFGVDLENQSSAGAREDVVDAMAGDSGLRHKAIEQLCDLYAWLLTNGSDS